MHIFSLKSFAAICLNSRGPLEANADRFTMGTDFIVEAMGRMNWEE
jgi:hypothetical protein